eukprot:scaffold256444_cov32-Tisochrysis_lutea.AAC.1
MKFTERHCQRVKGKQRARTRGESAEQHNSRRHLARAVGPPTRGKSHPPLTVTRHSVHLLTHSPRLLLQGYVEDTPTKVSESRSTSTWERDDMRGVKSRRMLTSVDALSLLIAQVRAGSLPVRAHTVLSDAEMSTSAPSFISPPSSSRRIRFCDIGAEHDSAKSEVVRVERDFGGRWESSCNPSQYAACPHLVHRGKTVHPDDLQDVLARAAEAGVERCLVTAGSLEEACAAIKMIRELRATSPVALYSTVGVHPTRSLNFLPKAARSELMMLMADVSAAEEAVDKSDAAADAVDKMQAAITALTAAQEHLLGTAEVVAAAASHVQALREAIRDGVSDGTVVAVGECGLDYARLFFSPAAVQRFAFDAQLKLAAEVHLPLFLHSRDASSDMESACRCYPEALAEGAVIHSFDGDEATLETLLKLGIDIGLNGCSLRTQQGFEVAAKVPLDRLHLETDAPWCGIKPSHVGVKHMRKSKWEEVKKEKWQQGCRVKDRNEPAQIEHVLQVLNAARGGTPSDEAIIADAALANSVRVFRLPFTLDSA